MLMDTAINFSTLDEATRIELLLASEHAYSFLTDRGYSAEEVHRLGVCHQATTLIVESLLDNGYRAEHEIRSGSAVAEHSYATLDIGPDEDIVIDPTWQQFLPKGTSTEGMPKVLIGTRSSVIEQALRFGVDEATTQLWQKQSIKLTAKQQRRIDLKAEQAADAAVKNGAWERFTTQNS